MKRQSRERRSQIFCFNLGGYHGKICVFPAEQWGIMGNLPFTLTCDYNIGCRVAPLDLTLVAHDVEIRDGGESL